MCVGATVGPECEAAEHLVSTHRVDGERCARAVAVPLRDPRADIATRGDDRRCVAARRIEAHGASAGHIEGRDGALGLRPRCLQPLHGTRKRAQPRGDLAEHRADGVGHR